jgi:cell division protein FtsB
VSRPRVLILAAGGLALLVAFSAYLGVSGLLGGEEPDGPDSARALRAERQRLVARVAALEQRVKELESRPEVKEALVDEGTRAQLTDLLAEAHRKDREAQERRRAAERAERTVGWYRSRYRELLEEARRETGAAPDSWEKLAPAFEKHFVPVGEAVKAKVLQDGGRSWGRVDISTAVAGVLPQTLASLKGALTDQQWGAFDAWRRRADFSRFGSSRRAEYFLPSAELGKVRAAAATERRWQEMKRALPILLEKLKLKEKDRDRLTAVIRGHAERFTVAFDGRPYVNVRDDDNRAKVRAVAARTDAEVKKLLDEAGYAAYEGWKKNPYARVHVYFGVEAADRRGPGGTRRPHKTAPGHRAPTPPKASGEVF